MIVVIEEHNAGKHARLLDEMFQLRARVFGSRLGWDVAVRGGRERDRFDDEGPVYIVHTDGCGRVDASCRLLPTTGPTLLADTFADTLPDAALLCSPSIWECTRFCVDHEAADRRSSVELLRLAGEVVAAAGTVAMRSGVDTLLGNFDAVRLRVFRRVGCEVDILGATGRFGQPVYLGAFRVWKEGIAAVSRRLDAIAPWPTAVAA